MMDEKLLFQKRVVRFAVILSAVFFVFLLFYVALDKSEKQPVIDNEFKDIIHPDSTRVYGNNTGIIWSNEMMVFIKGQEWQYGEVCYPSECPQSVNNPKYCDRILMIHCYEATGE